MYCLPPTFMPPELLISSTAISTTSRSEVSEIAIVPDSECKTPIFTVSAADAASPGSARHVAATAVKILLANRFMLCSLQCGGGGLRMLTGGAPRPDSVCGVYGAWAGRPFPD